MIVLILSIVLIGLAVLERILYMKRNKSWHRMRLFIEILITSLLFLIAYFITDSTIGTLYVFLSSSIFILIGIVNYRSDVEWFKYTSYIIGLPIMVYLLINAIQNMIINPQYLFLLLSVINLILSYSYKPKATIKETISLIIGFVIVSILMISYYKFFDSEDRIMLKQEIVAKTYLEEELEIDDLYIYTNKSSMKLRGEDIRIEAYNLSGISIIMTYKNGRIINCDIKND
ncbi:hypothetical protein [Tissierella sp.]|uniref:hypothetical protein n=1 Tax=Tissierella sp. TaxID=41274 RepID=UPI0028A98EA6|nr:hypothetical protein [Tissierella sp.]